MFQLRKTQQTDLLNGFWSCNVSPGFPVISSQVDQVLQHELYAAADVLLVGRLLDVLEVDIKWSKTLNKPICILELSSLRFYSYRNIQCSETRKCKKSSLSI
jgi:hypothetical protein